VKRLTVIGIDGSPLAPEALDRVTRAAVVAGAARHLAATPVPAAARRIVLGDVAAVAAELAAADGDAVVLASGDPGFFGVVRLLRAAGLDVEVYPARSSVTLAFARIGLPWDDAVVVSAHGRELRRAVNVCRAHRKVAVFTGPGVGPAELGAALTGRVRRLVVAENLGCPDERLAECTPEQAAAGSWRDPNLVLCLAPADAPGGMGWVHPPRHSPARWALDDAEFDHRDSMVTKAEVRALALAHLGPGVGDLVWDLGAGSASLGIECARFGAAVIAVDRDPRACDLARANAAHHRVEIDVVQDSAPGVLQRLADPDAVFVGGGGPDVVAAVAARRPARIVVALATLERVSPATDLLTGAGYRTGGCLLHADRLAPLGTVGTRLSGTNPVFLVWGEQR